MSVLMLDLAHFKRFNDNYGHDAGDYVLKTIGSLLLDTMRGEDTICRLGDEELDIILPNTGEQGALTAANSLCNAVNQLHLAITDLSLGKLSVSIGISTYPKNSMLSDELTKLADIALYEAKGRGRNQSCHYNDFVQGAEAIYVATEVNENPINITEKESIAKNSVVTITSKIQ